MRVRRPTDRHTHGAAAAPNHALIEGQLSTLYVSKAAIPLSAKSGLATTPAKHPLSAQRRT